MKELEPMSPRRTSFCLQLLSRNLLRQPQGQQGPDEDGPGAGAGWTCQLPTGSTGAWSRPQAHQRPQSGPDHGLRHLQCHCHCGRPSGEY